MSYFKHNIKMFSSTDLEKHFKGFFFVFLIIIFSINILYMSELIQKLFYVQREEDILISTLLKTQGLIL